MNPQELFCPNPSCPSSGQVGCGNIGVQSQKEQRCYCKTCAKTFAVTKGSAFYRLHKEQDLFVVVSLLLSEGCPPQAIVRAFGLDERTVHAWLQRTGQHCQRVHQHLVTEQPRDLQQVQADEMRVRLQRKLVAWMAMALQAPTRLWLGGSVSLRRDKPLIKALVVLVRACALYGPLLLVTDGFSAYAPLWWSVFRTALRTGEPGRPRLLSWPDVFVGQVLKQKEKGHVVGVRQRLVQGTSKRLRRLFGVKINLHTAYIERLNATFRARLAALVRRSRALARQTKTLVAGMYLVGTAYNFCTFHKSLRQERADGQRKWQPRTPAMAAGITDHRWTMGELLAYRIPPPPWIPPKKRGRPPKAVEKTTSSTLCATTV